MVAPTEHLKTQWAAAAARVGIQLDATFRNADLHSSADFHGAVVTYAQVGMAPPVHRRRTMTRRTLVILDEIHHAGDSRTWGDGVKAAFEPAVRRLMLTGTPFRSDDNPIPFVTLRAGRGRAAALPGRLGVRLRRRARRRRRPAGDLPGVLGRDPLAHQRRRRAGRPAGRADDPGPRRAGLAHRAGPDRRLDAAGAAGRRRPAAGAAGRRHARRRRPGHRQRPDARPGRTPSCSRRSPARRPWWCSPTTRAPPAGSPRSPRSRAALAGRRADGLRGRRHPAAGRRRLRHQRLHAAVLRPGDRPVRPGPPAGGDGERLPAQRAAPARAGQRDGGRSATTCSARRRSADGLDDDLLERAQQAEEASGELEKRFEALSATAELDQVIFDGASFGTAGADRHARGGGVPRPARPAHARPGGGAADQAPGRAAGRAAQRGPRSRCPAQRGSRPRATCRRPSAGSRCAAS